MKIKLLYLLITLFILQSCSGTIRFSSVAQPEDKSTYQSGDVFLGLAPFIQMNLKADKPLMEKYTIKINLLQHIKQ